MCTELTNALPFIFVKIDISRALLLALLGVSTIGYYVLKIKCLDWAKGKAPTTTLHPDRAAAGCLPRRGPDRPCCTYVCAAVLNPD